MGKKKGARKDDDDPFADLGEDVSQNNAQAEEPKEEAPEVKEEEAPQQKAEQESEVPAADEPPRLLTKKEKEKLKKEREKAKKKEQAAQKKASAPKQEKQAEPKEEPEEEPKEEPKEVPKDEPKDEPKMEEKPEPADGAPAESDEEGPSSAADKKKKKKKKKAEPAAPPPRKAPNAAVAALQARIAAQKKAAEEERLAEEAERRRIEEEERKEREEEERKEAERQRRKEKDRLKKEQLKKDGKLLTPKQRAELKAAEARKEAMLASSNISVAGMGKEKPARRAVYDKKKKPKKPEAKPEPEPEPEPQPQPEPEPEQPADEPADDVKDDWEADSDVKDDWEAESEEEPPAPPEKAKPTAQEAKPVDKEAKPAAKEAAKMPEKPPAKAAAAEEKSASDDDDDDDDESEGDDLTSAQRMALEKRTATVERRRERHEQAMAERSKDNLRSPICVILGHVDTGKTKLLDKVRQTNVQTGEAGGITQQIGATYFPIGALKEKTAVLDVKDFEYKVPGLLVIDTPGHESFTNLRSRGSSLCNIAILVVDIMHGLEQQTLESIRLLRDRRTPFIVALNKVDRLYDWKATPNNAFLKSLAKQGRNTKQEFEDRVEKTILAFAEQGFNSELYYKNKNMGRYVSLVPTSAISGEGIPDMLQLLVSLTQSRMSSDLMYLSELQCTVLEVKVVEGLGTTIDVVLSNGVLNEGDRIVVCGLNGPIVTQVRALLTPQPLKEMRVKGSYIHHKQVKAALGVKIAAPDLDKAVAGSRLLVVGPEDDEEVLKEEVMSDLTTMLNSVDTSGRGVCVQASTLGSLEALLEFLRQSKIPVSGINIGPVYKKDVMRCATMLEKARELACILCFDVPVDKEAERLAEELGVRLFTANIIYHLFDMFVAYNNEIMESKKREAAGTAVWPCRLKTIAAFAKRDPIILGCDITEGSLRVGTPLCVIKTDAASRKREVISIGRVSSLEINHKPRDVVFKKDVGAGVAVRIEPGLNEAPKMFGRHFEEKDEIFSLISRQSIDALKEHFWDGVSIEEKRLIKFLKPLLDIP